MFPESPSLTLSELREILFVVTPKIFLFCNCFVVNIWLTNYRCMGMAVVDDTFSFTLKRLIYFFLNCRAL